MNNLMGQRLKSLRIEQGLSLKQVAEQARIPLSTYREWENGRQIIGEPYEKIAGALNTSLYTLLTGKTSNLSKLREFLAEIRKLSNDIERSLESFEK